MKNLYENDEINIEQVCTFQRNKSSDVYVNEKVIFWMDENNCSVEIFGKYNPCRFLLTEFKIVIIPKIEKKIFDIFQEDHFCIQLITIENISLDDESKSISIITIDVEDFRKLKLKVNYESSQILFEKLAKLELVNESDYLNHAIKYKEFILKNNLIDYNIILKGYQIYDAEKEYERQGISDNNHIILSLINKDYNLCETYPEITYLISSKEITEQTYRESAKYRTKNRYPALSFFDKKTKGSIWRSSQNRAGITNENNISDEIILESIGEISHAELIYGIKKTLFICDARSIISAKANRLIGAGHENVENYRNTEIFFCEIENIHEVRESFQAFKKALLNEQKNEQKKSQIDNDYSLIYGTGLRNIYDNTNFFSEVEKTNWFKYIHKIIKSSILIYSKVNLGLSVLVHCSDGWDRCPQLICLSCLFLDKYYRTLIGFIVLIEKEFISFGHQFKFRLGLCPLSTEKFNTKQISPIFLQFLDCVHQLWKEYKSIFEFNLEFLGFIALNLKRGKFGNFLCNSEKERKEKKIYEKTVSIWSEVLNNKNLFINEHYNEEESENFKIRDFPYYKIKLWDEYYLKYYKSNKKKESYNNNKNSINLQKENDELRKIIQKLIKSDNNNIKLLTEEEIKLINNNNK